MSQNTTGVHDLPAGIVQDKDEKFKFKSLRKKHQQDTVTYYPRWLLNLLFLPGQIRSSIKKNKVQIMSKFTQTIYFWTDTSVSSGIDKWAHGLCSTKHLLCWKQTLSLHLVWPSNMNELSKHTPIFILLYIYTDILLLAFFSEWTC